MTAMSVSVSPFRRQEELISCDAFAAIPNEPFKEASYDKVSKFVHQEV